MVPNPGHIGGRDGSYHDLTTPTLLFVCSHLSLSRKQFVTFICRNIKSISDSDWNEKFKQAILALSHT